MEDVQNAGNFQGIVMMLPGLSALFISPVAGNPDGIIAQIGSYVPFTTSVVMILRVTLTELNLVEIIIPIVILLVSTVLMAKLAGKIFRVGMLMYGKEADPKEIWKWVRQ
jgi:ABC-2 type transport system permease protein